MSFIKKVKSFSAESESQHLCQVHFETNEYAVIVFSQLLVLWLVNVFFGNVRMSPAERIEYIQGDFTINALRHNERRNFVLPIVSQW